MLRWAYARRGRHALQILREIELHRHGIVAARIGAGDDVIRAFGLQAIDRAGPLHGGDDLALEVARMLVPLQEAAQVEIGAVHHAGDIGMRQHAAGMVGGEDQPVETGMQAFLLQQDARQRFDAQVDAQHRPQFAIGLQDLGGIGHAQLAGGGEDIGIGPDRQVADQRLQIPRPQARIVGRRHHAGLAPFVARRRRAVEIKPAVLHAAVTARQQQAARAHRRIDQAGRRIADRRRHELLHLQEGAIGKAEIDAVHLRQAAQRIAGQRKQQPRGVGARGFMQPRIVHRVGEGHGRGEQRIEGFRHPLRHLVQPGIGAGHQLRLLLAMQRQRQQQPQHHHDGGGGKRRGVAAEESGHEPEEAGFSGILRD